ncbi:hypothetical protein AB0M43_14315 [Longispora sp. NPDC051575]|uniref:protein kinase domain-containing protein n=1 Tax=Longispora sp. NPDC051575 TaxID=3154943 RepID=UPI003415D92B
MSRSDPAAPEPYVFDPTGETGRRTRARFEYQDECVALRCIANLLSDQVHEILVEWSTDYLVGLSDGGVELVSVKHREPDRRSWTMGEVVREILLGLFRVWRQSQDGCVLVFESNAPVTRAVRAQLTPHALADGLNGKGKTPTGLFVDEAEAARFSAALVLDRPALPSREHISAVGIRRLGAVLNLADRDSRLAETCYGVLLRRIATAGTERQPTAEEQIGLLVGAVRDLRSRRAPDSSRHRLRMADLRDLVFAAHDEATHRPPRPLVARTDWTPTPRPWSGGDEIRIGDSAFLLHDPVRTEIAPDRAWCRHHARARQLEPVGRDVWLTGLVLNRRDAPAVAELRTERSLYERHPELPDLVAVDDRALAVQVPNRAVPVAEVYGQGDTPVPRFLLFRLFRGLPSLARPLHVLHRLGRAHRDLRADNILVLPDGSLCPRDLGLAARPAVAGEGTANYRAPEQWRPASTPPGPTTDVYQLAAVLYHLATGHPADQAPPEPSAVHPDLPRALDDLLLGALATDQEFRPDLTSLVTSLARLGGGAA